MLLSMSNVFTIVSSVLTSSPTKVTVHCTADGFPRMMAPTGQQLPCQRVLWPDNACRLTNPHCE